MIRAITAAQAFDTSLLAASSSAPYKGDCREKDTKLTTDKATKENTFL